MDSVQTKIIKKLKAIFSRKQGLILGKGGLFSVVIFLIFSTILANPFFAKGALEMDISMFVVNKDTNKPLEGTHSVNFGIYLENSDVPVWQEEQEVEVNYGLIKTILGTITTLPVDLNPQINNYYLGVKIDDDKELEPRKKISLNQFAVTAVYALNAGSLNNRIIGEGEGDIMVLGNGGEIDTAFLPGDISYFGDEVDISSYTNLGVSGSLLTIDGDNISLKEGELVDGRLCSYDSDNGLVCNIDGSTVIHDLVSLNGAYDYLTLSGQAITLGAIDLATDTTGNYVQSITTGNGITGGDGGSESAVLTLAVDVATTGATSATYSNSGLEVSADGLRLIGGCVNGQILTWDSNDVRWECTSNTAGSSNWTDTGDITYLTDLANDFAIGGGSLASSIFAIDESEGAFHFGSDASSDPTFNFTASDSDTGIFGFNANDSFYFAGAHVGIGTATPTAYLHITAGTANTGTAPIKLTSGINLTTPETGALEYDGTDLYFTPGLDRETIAYMSDITAAGHSPVTVSDTATIDLTLATQALSADIVAESIGDTQLAYNTGQHLTTTSSPTFGGLNLTGLAGVLKATGGIVSGSATTTDLPEGTNLYYTQTRFDNAFSAKSTTNLTEGTNLYYTDARAREAISTTATGLTYTNTTGVLSLTTGYVIPTTTEESNWNSAYSLSHNALTIGTANGLSLSTQQLSLGLASAGVTGALSGTDWSTFNSKQNALTIGNLVGTTDQVSVAGGDGAIIGSGVTLSLPQSIATTSAPTFATLNTGQGAYELYAMNQDVLTTSSPTFGGLTLSFDISNYTELSTDASGNFQIQPTSGIAMFNTSGLQNYLRIYDSAGTDYLQLTHNGTDAQITTNTGAIEIGSVGDFVLDSGVNIGIGLDTPTAYLHITAGTANTGTAPIKLTSGINLTTPETGALEYDGTDLYFTPTGTTRETIAYMSDITAAGHSPVTVSDTATIDLTLATQALSADIVAESIGDTQLAYNTGQHLTTTSTPTFATLNTGQGAYELYAMNQDVLTTSSPTFGGLTLSSALTVPNGGTGATTLTSGGILYGAGTGAIQATDVLTNGQLLIGDGSGAPTLATLTEGTAMDIANGAGSISIGFDSTELGTTTWYNGTAGNDIVWTFDGEDNDGTFGYYEDEDAFAFTNGYLGVGLTNPSTALQVTGDFSLSRGATRIISVQDSGNSFTEGYDLKILAGKVGSGGPAESATGGDIYVAGGLGVSDNYFLGGNVILAHNGTSSLGKVGIGTITPTAYLHITAGTAGTAPIKLTSGTNLTTPETGALEYDGTDLYFTPGLDRETIAYMSDITASAVTLTNSPATYDYLTISGQAITLNQINLGTDITGVLAMANGGTSKNMTALAGSIAYSDADSLELSAVGIIGQALISGGIGTPTWFAPTAGSILFAGADGILSQDNASFFFDDSVNRLGIGTATPASMLDVYGTGNELRLSYDATNYVTLAANASGELVMGGSAASGSSMVIGSGLAEDTSVIFDGNAQDYYVGLDDTDDALHIGLGQAVGTTPYISMLSSGNIGIGITSPTAYLNIKAGTATAGTAPIKLASGTNLTTPETGALEYNGSELYFTPTGTTRETIAYTSDITAITIADGTVDTSILTWDDTGGNWVENSDLLIDASGNLTTTGTIEGLTLTSAADGFTIAGGTTSRTLTISGADVSINQSLLTTSAPTFATLNTGQGAYELYAMNQDVLTTSSPTFAGMTLNGNLIPGTDDTYDLGSTTARWKDLYLGGETIHLGSSATDEASISYTSGNILNFSTDATTNGDISFFTDDLYLDKSSGSIGIGTTTPSHILDINGAAGVANLLQISTNGTSLIRVTDEGTVFDTPVSFNNVGDISLGYSLLMTNATAGSVKFQGPGYIETESISDGLDLTLRAANEGFVVVEDTLQNVLDLTTTTAGNYYGFSGDVDSTGIFTTGTTNVYGMYADASAIGVSTGGTVNTYGGYLTAIGENTGAATTNAYGLYVNGATGADNNYSAVFMNGNVGIGDATPSALLTVGASDAFQVDASGNLSTTGTIEGLTLTSAADGFTVAGGTTPRTLTISGADVSINQSLLTTSAPTFGGLTLSSALTVPNGGTGATTLTSGGILYGAGTGAIQATDVLTNGQLLIGDGSGVPTLATLTEGTAIDIANGAGSISIGFDSTELGTTTWYNGTAGNDIVWTFDGEDNDGTFGYYEDEDRFTILGGDTFIGGNTNTIDSGGTSITVVDDTTDPAIFASLAIASDGFARIGYGDAATGALKFAQCTNADCSTKTITTVDATGSAEYTSLAIASDGFARISYEDGLTGDLKFAQCTNADCSTKTITTVDTSSEIWDISIAIASDGFARISYGDAATGDLKFAQCTNADCSTKTIAIVDATGSAGYTSLAIASDGFARISYTDDVTGALKFAQCTNADCSTKTITTVDATGSAIFTSIAIASDGFTRISYVVSGDLKFAQCTNADCSTKTITTVDATGSAGYTSLAIASDGFTRISYGDEITGDLKFAQCTNADCSTKTITTVDATGSAIFTSIAIASDGFARIGYGDVATGDLKLATVKEIDFNPNGDDLFVADSLGVEGDIISDGSLLVSQNALFGGNLWTGGNITTDSSLTIGSMLNLATGILVAPQYLFTTDGFTNLAVLDETGLGIGMDSPTAILHLKAGIASANGAPLKLTSGVNLTTPETGALEYDGTKLYFTPTGTTRETVAYLSDLGTTHDELTLANSPATYDYLTITGQVITLNQIDLGTDITGVLAMANGGTNKLMTASAGSIAYSDVDSLELSAVGTAGQALISGGTGAPTWFAPNQGSILFAGADGILSQDNSNFFFDDSTNRLGIGTTGPTAMVDIYGTGNELRLSYSTSYYASLSAGTNGELNITSTATTDSAVVIGNGLPMNALLQFDGETQDFYFGVDAADSILKIGNGSTVGTATAISITSGGNVGIGDPSPAALLTVGTSDAFQVDASGNLTTTGTIEGLTLTSAADGFTVAGGTTPRTLTISGADVSINQSLLSTSAPTFASLTLFYNTPTADQKLLTIGTSDDASRFSVDEDGDYFYDGTGSTPSADYAEYFYTEDTDLTSGEAVCIDITNNNTIERCQKDGDSNIMGIVSTKPALVGNSKPEYAEDENYKIVGMLGQVPAKVSDENGKINPGDSLTASSIPGVLRKANSGESTVGVALEIFNNQHSTFNNKVGEINVMISRKNKSISVSEVEQQVTERIAQMEIEDEVNLLVSEAVSSLNFDQALVDIDLRLSDFETKSLEESKILTTLADSFSVLENKQEAIQEELEELTLTLNGNLELTNLLTQKTLERETRIQVLEDQVAYLAQNLLNNDQLETNNISFESLLLKENQTVLGSLATQLSYNINGDVFEFNLDGELIVKKIKTEKVETEVVVSGEYTVSNKENETDKNTGSATILAGQTELFVENAKIKDDSRIILTPIGDSPVNWIISEKREEEGFTIKLQEAIEFEVEFDYWIVQIE